MEEDQAGRPELRQITADDWRLWRELRLAALRDAPAAFSSRLSDGTGPGDTEDRWRTRLTSFPCNVVAYLDGLPAGIISGAPLAGHRALLGTMWVAPRARGRGVGDALVEAIIEWAGRLGAAGVHLDVFADNERAIALYRRHGFVDRGPKRPDPDQPPTRGQRRMERPIATPDQDRTAEPSP